MPTNIEIKALARDFAHLKVLATALSGGVGEVLAQQDTFYEVPNGRLKLRRLTNVPAQLIYYQRNDDKGPKESQYSIATIHQPDQLHDVLRKSLGVRGTVNKFRTLHVVGQTRIHLDDVEGLGQFIELEVVLKPDQSRDDGLKIANDLMAKLGIEGKDLIAGAYMDLLTNTKHFTL